MDKESIISLAVSLVLSAVLATTVAMGVGGENPRGESLLPEKVITVVLIAPLVTAFVFCISLLLRGKFTNPHQGQFSGTSLAQGFLYFAWAVLACASIYFYLSASSASEKHFQDAERHFQEAEKALGN